MATKKAKTGAPAAGKVAASRVTAATAASASATAPAGNSQRLLREAAWSRMFGRADTKNPFARSR
jgi:hypothetical protein